MTRIQLRWIHRVRAFRFDSKDLRCLEKYDTPRVKTRIIYNKHNN